MNLLKTKLRRTTAVLAGTVLGLAGVAALASPASAHSPVVLHNNPCVESDGSWAVVWKIGNDFRFDATVGEITATVKKTNGSESAVKVVGPITEPGVVIPKFTAGDYLKSIAAATKITSSDVTSVTLKTILVWPEDNYTNDGKNGNRPPEYTTVDKPTKKCAGTTATPPATTPPTTTPTEATPTPTETPTLPVPTDAPNVFKPILEEDCTTMTIGADNPADGITWKFDLKTSKGEERSFTLKPGQKHTEKFSATKGFSIKITISVTVDGKTYSDFDTVKYETPSNCTGGKGGGGGLPVTGTPTAAIAGGAVAVLVLGAVLFFLARRRKVKFTA